ncbi:MAG: carbohydrate ABC transporter permease [Pirellulaceae bacterium]
MNKLRDGEPSRRKPLFTRSTRQTTTGYSLILPNTLGLVFFFALPIGIALGLAFFTWNIFQPPTFAGFDNFKKLIQDPVFFRSAGNTIKLVVVSVPLQMALATVIALGLNMGLRGTSFLRTAYFLPLVTSTVAAAAVFAWIFQPSFGFVNLSLEAVGLGQPDWFADPNLVLIPIAIIVIWQRVGLDTVLILAGLQAIPQMYHDVATVDGATAWQRFRYVTVPLLSPTLFLVAVLETIFVFQVFDQVIILTSKSVLGGVGGSASTLSFYFYKAGFLQNKFGYAATIALAQFVLILCVTGFQLFAQKRWVHYASD